MKHLLLLLSLWVVSAPPGAETTPEREIQLEHLLVQDCGSCHGLTLKGGLGPALLPERLQAMPRDFLISTILDGREGTAMPPWSGLLSKQDADWLVDRLRSKKPGGR